MIELLWLTLPLAALSGWYGGRREGRRAARADPGNPCKGPQGPDGLADQPQHRAAQSMDTRLSMGSLLRRQGEADCAIHIHRALADGRGLSESGRARARLELARDYLGAGLLDRAEGMLRELGEAGIEAASAYRHLRDLYEQEGDWPGAIWAARRLQASDGDGQGCLIAHYLCEQAQVVGSPEAHTDLARQALATDPHCVRALFILAEAAEAAGDHAMARRWYEQALIQDRGFLVVLLPRIAACYRALDDEAGYLAFLAGIEPGDGCEAVIVAKAEALARCGRQRDAESLLEAEVRRQPGAPRVAAAYLYAMSRSQEADLRQAMARAARALELGHDQRPGYRCGHCGFEARTLFWHCPGCHHWGSVKPLDGSALTPPPPRSSVSQGL